MFRRAVEQGWAPEAILGQCLEVRTAAMSGALPRWDHIVTAKSYNQALARKQLLQSPVRASLADIVSDLGMFKEDAVHCVEKLRNDRQEEKGQEEKSLPSEFLAADNALDVAHQCTTPPFSKDASTKLRNSFQEATSEKPWYVSKTEHPRTR